MATTKTALGHPAAFAIIATGSLAVFLLAVVSQHLSLQTSAFDFGLMDEALAGESGGRFMHTEAFGYSLLGEHFYLLMAILIPFRRLIGSPWVTIAAHALLLWAAIFPLRAVLKHERVKPWLIHFVCLMYACHPIVARTLSYVFHPEAAYPVCVLTLYWGLITNRRIGYVLALLATLAIKEDAAVYLIGFSCWIAIAHGRTRIAVLTAAASLLWLGLALKVWMPGFGAPEHQYRFIARWVEYGATPVAIALGMLSHPAMLFSDLFSRQPLLMFAGLGLLPFVTRWGWVVVLLPWLINATSAGPMQAGFALYYGMPVLAFALPAALAALSNRSRHSGSTALRDLTRGRYAPAMTLAVAVLNVAHFDLPRPYSHRAAIVAELKLIPRGEPVQVLPCLYPLNGYWAGKRSLMPGAGLASDTRYVAWLNHHHPWPFTQSDLARVGHRLRKAGWTDLSSLPALTLLRHPALILIR